MKTHAPATQRSGHILVIVDHPDIRELITTILQADGHHVASAHDGDMGVQMAQRDPPDVILLDLMMPKLHGYQVLQSLRANPATQRSSIIVVSAKAYASDKRKALDMGAVAYLQKPFEAAALRAIVRQHLNKAVVTFWGARGSIAAPGPGTLRYGGNTPCVTLSYGGAQIILDAGTGIRPLGVRSAARAARYAL